jgi:glycerate kinase
MRILAAFDKFKDSFTAQTACSLAQEVTEERISNCEVVACPLTDGGDGFVEVLSQKYNTKLRGFEVRDSLGTLRKVKIGIVSITDLTSDLRSFLTLPPKGKLAIVEMASVCGLSDLEPVQRDPWKTTTLGVGDLLLLAKSQEVDGILLGIGGSSTNDAGVGALCGLGLKFKDKSGESIQYPSPSNWSEFKCVDISSLETLPPIYIACDVDNQLLGPEGATYQFGPQKGLPRKDLPLMEQAMKDMIAHLEKSFPQAPSIAQQSGSGAAGGIGFGLSLAYKVQLVSGFELVSLWLSLKEEVKRADFILTGEGRFDQTSWRGKGPFEIISIANQAQKKTALICGSIDPEIREKSIKEFPCCRFSSFAKEDWRLEKNLLHGPELFSQALREIYLEVLQKNDFECPTIKEARFKRIRRLKKFLRPLPRRSNIHRYPVLKWFSETAYKKSFLWSFRAGPVQMALFWGLWISMLPIVGIQMVVVFLVSLLVRANLPLIVALQWISNPLTMGPIYFADYKIGMTLLKLLGFDYPPNKILSPKYDWSEFSYKELLRLIDTFPPMFLGGSVLGVFFGVFAVFLYKILSRFYKK